MSDTPTKTQFLLAQVAVGLLVAFAVAGVAVYGLSADVFQRMWRNLVDRPGGPMTFRFILQPVMVTIAAALDGIKDARTGRTPYAWAMLTDPSRFASRLREGVIATARVILLGLGMDLIYQIMVFGTFHPGEAVVIAILLAFVPYLLLRGPAQRIARWWGVGPADAHTNR
jgi:predicted membrane protein